MVPLEVRPAWGRKGLPSLVVDEPEVPPWFVARDEPSHVALRLHEELLDFAAFVRPTAADEAAHRRWVSKIEVAARSLWRECEVYVFGSRATGLCLPSANVDIAIAKVPLPRATTALKHLAERMLGSGQVSRLEIIQSKKEAPVMKLQERSTGLWADVVVNELDGLSVSYFVREQVEAFPAIVHLLVFLKLFLLQRGLHDASTGGMSSYVLMCVLLSFLQRHPSSRVKHLHETTSLGNLLFDFFRYYGQEFEYGTLGICVANGGSLFDRKARGWTGSARAGQAVLCLESPQEPGVDIGARVFRIGAIRAAFNHGYQQLRALLLSQGLPRQSSLLCPHLIHSAHPVISQRYNLLEEQPPLLAELQPLVEPQPSVELQPLVEHHSVDGDGDDDATEGEDSVPAKRRRLGDRSERNSDTVVICPTGVEDPMGEVLDTLCASQDAERMRDSMEEVLDAVCADAAGGSSTSASKNSETAHDPMGDVLDMLVAEAEEEEVLDVPLGEADAEAAASRSQADAGDEEVLLLPSCPVRGEEPAVSEGQEIGKGVAADLGEVSEASAVREVTMGQSAQEETPAARELSSGIHQANCSVHEGASAKELDPAKSQKLQGVDGASAKELDPAKSQKLQGVDGDGSSQGAEAGPDNESGPGQAQDPPEQRAEVSGHTDGKPGNEGVQQGLEPSEAHVQRMGEDSPPAEARADQARDSVGDAKNERERAVNSDSNACAQSVPAALKESTDASDAPGSTASSRQDVEMGLQRAGGGGGAPAAAADGLGRMPSSTSAVEGSKVPTDLAAATGSVDHSVAPNTLAAGVSVQLADVEVASKADDGAAANAGHVPGADAGASLAAPVKVLDLTGIGGHGAIGHAASSDGGRTAGNNPDVMSDPATGLAVPAVKREENEDSAESDDRLGVSPCTDEEGTALGSAEDEAAYYRTAGSLAELVADAEEGGEDFESVVNVKAQLPPVCDDCPDFEDI